MNNQDAFTFLNQNESSSSAARKYMEIFKLDEFHFNALKSKFNKLKLSRTNYVKNQNIDTWNSQPFRLVEVQDKNFAKKRKSVSTDDSIFTVLPETLCSTCNSQRVTLCLHCSGGTFVEHISVQRKHISELKLESQRFRFDVLLQHIKFIANREGVNEKVLQIMHSN